MNLKLPVAFRTSSRLLWPTGLLRSNVLAVSLCYRVCTASAAPPAGSEDPSFASPVVNGAIMCFGQQTDGKILIGGTFTQADSISTPGLARLTTNGTLDATFVPRIEFWPGLSNQVRQIIVEPDDRILVSGLFTHPSSDGAVDLLRLEANGAMDAGFRPRVRQLLTGATNLQPVLPPVGVVRQSDGKILTAWPSEVLAPQGGSPIVTAYTIRRYQSDGAVDAAYPEKQYSNFFGVGVLNGMLRLPGDSIVVLGYLQDAEHRADMAMRPLLRYDVNGRYQPCEVAFNYRWNCYNLGVCPPTFLSDGVVQNDGRLLSWGSFQVPGVEGQCIRVKPTGGVDFTFHPVTVVNRIALQLHDETLLADTSAGPQWLDKDGMRLAGWNGPTPSGPAMEQPDGKIVLVDGQGRLRRLFGPDRTVQPPAITDGPRAIAVAQAPADATTLLSVRATGYPLRYQWSLNDHPFPADGSTINISGQSGRFAVTVSNNAGSVTSAEFECSAAPTIDEALGVPGWTFLAPPDTHGRWGPDTVRAEQWSVQAQPEGGFSTSGECVSYPDDVFTAQLQITLAGPGVLRYWSSGSGALEVSVGLKPDVFQQVTHTSTNWVPRTLRLPSGPRTVAWRPALRPGGTYAITYLDRFHWEPIGGDSSRSPVLKVVSRGTGTWALTWPEVNVGVILQQSSVLDPADWRSVLGTATTNYFPLEAEPGSRFFRLFRP